MRRARLVLGALALVGGLVACSDAPEDASRRPAATTHDHGTTAPGTGHDHHCPDRGVPAGDGFRCVLENAVLVSRWPFTRAVRPDELRDALDFAARTEESAYRYIDIADAVADGYTFNDRLALLDAVRGTAIEQEERALLEQGVVTHLVSEERANDGVALDPARPDALMYATDGERYVLVGAMFIAPEGTDGPQIGGSLTTWHLHNKGDTVCWEGVAAVGFARVLPGDDRYAPSGGCARGRPLEESPQMLHVWFGHDEPDATFHDEMTLEDAARVLRG